MTVNALEIVAEQAWIDKVAEPLSHGVRDTFEKGGPVGARTKDALHGVWLGHPLHPVLTDIPVGAWTTATALDIASAANHDEGLARAADFAVGFGLIGAAGAAVTGLTDWSETGGRSRRIGLLHGLLNVVATGLVATSWILRKQGNRSAGRVFSAAGLSMATASAYLGGQLVYGERIGVMHAVDEPPDELITVLASAELPEGSMKKVRVGDANILLVRQHGRVCALAHSCSHLGGPLSEGTLKEGSVVCPWHGSEFALDDGHVIGGPATQPQPVFSVREENGQISVGPANQ